MPRGIPTADTEGARAFARPSSFIDALPVDQAQVVVRAFTPFFHLANPSEENYCGNAARVERNVSMESVVATSNELVVAAYGHLLTRGALETHGRAVGSLGIHPGVHRAPH